MPPQSHPTLQRGMRKGTHSCYECRKRKVRCIFTKESTICGNCELKGRRCTEQRRELIQAGNVDTRESLRENIKRLEAVIEDYGRKSSSTAPDEVNRNFNVDLGDVREDKLSSESPSSEFGAKRTPVSTPSSLETSASVDKTSSQDIDPIVTLFDNAIWRSHGSDLIPERISKLDKAENPATAKKHIRTRESLLSSLISPVLREIVVNATCSWWYTWRPLGSILLSSTGNANSTLPDFILWALESPDPSIIVNLGLNRKCWILTHQAISYSQLLNLHRPHLSTDKNTLEKNQRIQSWLSLCAGDVYLSLLLGLPYAADGRTIPTTHNQNNPTAQFHHNLIILSSKVIDRNQRSLHLSIPHTQKIQTSLLTATQILPPSFWDPQTSLSQNKISRPEYLEQIAAQSFVCSTLLILSMLGYGSCENGGRDENNDRELIARTIASLTQAGNSLGNLVAKQAVQGLESLMLMGRENCPRREERRGDGEGEVLSLRNPYAKIVVPYVGVITISPGEYYNSVETAIDAVAEMQTQSHSAPFSFSLDSNPIPNLNHNHNQNHEDLRSGGGPNHHNTNTRYEDTSTLGEAREVPIDTQGQRQIQVGWTSIDFDWASDLTAGFEDDWAWLNGLGG
ncbi:hypothetical protein BPAE_0107g00020 [Botrytis paeoniae]|uniref:Zn(2)-C6 fungal-type domain-containing protein n=1 Tax=Botrytis paeoniae TaxID=278948 RepID=A0A4Z1FID4_9HELO|nr:hypothetical protein BPAE_0107g00020 [Botrytis paeoniae]